MKRFSLVFMVIGILLVFSACQVNESTGSISFVNSSDKDATLKVGTQSLQVSAGSSSVVYFTTAESAAAFSVEGVSIEDVMATDPDDGVYKEVKSIKLELNYQYFGSLRIYDGDYILYFSRIKAGTDLVDDDDNSDFYNF